MSRRFNYYLFLLIFFTVLGFLPIINYYSLNIFHSIVTQEARGYKLNIDAPVTYDSYPLWTNPTSHAITSLDISGTGEYIVSGTSDNQTLLYNKNSSVLIWSYITDGSVTSAVISKDGRYIAVGTSKGIVYGLNRSSLSLLWINDTKSIIRSLAISADGQYIVAGNDIGKAYLFNISSSEPLWTYDMTFCVNTVSISASGGCIAAGTEFGQIFLFNNTKSNPIWVNNTLINDIISVSISADGQFITAGDDGGNLFLFKNNSANPVWKFTISGYYRCPVKISQDGNYIIAGFNKIYIFNRNSSEPISNYTIGGFSGLNSIAISGDGQYFTFNSKFDSILHLYNRSRQDPIWEYFVYGLSNKVLTTISEDGKYYVVTLQAGPTNYIIMLFSRNPPPMANNPGSFVFFPMETKNFTWMLWDLIGPGKYRVILNDVNNNNHTLQDWTDWINDTGMTFDINTTYIGNIKYIIEYNNSEGMFGVPGTVNVGVGYQILSQYLFIIFILIHEINNTGSKNTFLEILVPLLLILVIGIFIITSAVIIKLVRKSE